MGKNDFYLLLYYLASVSSPRVHQYVRMVQSYQRRRERLGPEGGAVDLKFVLELSLNALNKLVLFLQAGRTISYADLDLLRGEVFVLVECAISEILSLLRSRCKYLLYLIYLNILLRFQS